MPLQFLFSVLSSLGLAGAIIAAARMADLGSRDGVHLAVVLGCTAVSVAATALLPGRIAAATGTRRAGLRRAALGRVLRAQDLPDAGRAVAVLGDDVDRAAVYRGTFLGPMLGSLTAPLLVLLAIGVWIDPVSAAVLALAAAVIPFAIRGFLALTKKSSGAYRRSSAQLAALLLDALRGLATLSYLGAERAFGRSLARRAEALRRSVLRVLAVSQSIILVIDLVFVLFFTLGAAALALWRLEDGHIGPAQAAALVLLSLVLSEPIDRVGQFFYQGASGRAAEARVRELESLRPPYPDAPGVSVADDPVDPGGTAGLGGGLRAENVTVSGPDGTLVLNDLDLNVPAGSTVGVVGESGAGKTTLLRLLAGLRAPDSGRIVVAGAQAASAPDAVRAAVAAVSQEAGVIDASIAANLRLAAPGASDAELWAVLEQAQLADEVRAMPAGLETRTGEAGRLLSGGQRSRLAIARALLRDAPVLLLDEPTAHLDPQAEARVTAAIRTAVAGRTAVIVSHRPAALAGVTDVYELREGRLVRR
ncbi:ATP-binding cassette domain-containing protein [Sediminivirga luteola]|uniref:ATP-binding cassette subfamily C protein CydD n=1 Tax=Sediminivirga luteola TaxID=1774748 RepID=A0A8J2TYS9_9MICO|nr:ATP-binding cassette domain-containing protein [Sediminivirga luteola]GGA17258.1 hypothetical protein GCM10011333_20420 [Sediminivirga luteola]